MKRMQWNRVLTAGGLCLVAAAAGVAAGYLGVSVQAALVVLALMLVSAGASIRRQAS